MLVHSTPSPARQLAALLPPAWHHLSELPEAICLRLLDLALANQGCGWPAIQANYKLTHLAAMSATDIEAAFALAVAA